MAKSIFYNQIFQKFEATGNDFIVFEAPRPKTIGAKIKADIAKACQSHYGIGADGFVWLSKTKKGVEWRFFNRDGSEAGLCGNAARVVAKILLDKSTSKKKNRSVFWLGQTGGFTGKASAPSGHYAVSWCDFSFELSKRSLPDDLAETLLGYNDHGIAGIYLLNVGVPHLVLLNHETWGLEQRVSSSPLLRSFPSLGPEGTNVTWVSNKTMNAVTYERGVEQETLACGSGALAAYLAISDFRRQNGGIYSQEDFKEVPLEFKFPGGPLKVSRSIDKKLWLMGPANRVFSGKYLGS